MSDIRETNCPFHFQDDPDYCGAAVAMMLLAKQGIPYDQLNQDIIYHAIRERNRAPKDSPWRSDPWGVERTLEDLQPGLWRAYIQPTLSLATRDAVYSVWHGRPALALVKGGGHWMVLDSVSVEGDPTTEDFQLNTLWLHDSSDDLGLAPEEHSGSDICHMMACPEKLDWWEWREEYLLGEPDEIWGGEARFVVISDTEEHDSFGMPIEIPEPTLPYINALEASERAAEIASRKITGPYAEVYEAIRRRAKPRHAVRVRRLEKGGDEAFYYLVPFLEEDRVLATMKLDMRGRFRSMRAYQHGFVPSFGSFFDEKLSMEQDGFFWKPCAESKSPHLPFQAEFTADGGAPLQGDLSASGEPFLQGKFDASLVRLDGRLIKEISPLKRG